MNLPDFTINPIYEFKVYDTKNNNLLYKGVLNSKAWSKTLETSDIWEYVSENGRVISKDFNPLIVDIKNINIDKNQIDFYLIESNNKQLSTNENYNSILSKLENVILKRKKEMPPNSYTTHLFEKGEEKILKKLGEEAIELILASKSSKDEIIYETADLVYHILVYLSYKEIKVDEILSELQKRMEK